MLYVQSPDVVYVPQHIVCVLMCVCVRARACVCMCACDGVSKLGLPDVLPGEGGPSPPPECVDLSPIDCGDLSPIDCGDLSILTLSDPAIDLSRNLPVMTSPALSSSEERRYINTIFIFIFFYDGFLLCTQNVLPVRCCPVAISPISD